ncbi:MAG: hypothetical protein CMA53_03885 [Euryarchaeota archaeon]|nr:hypothetical protein [Euryarchaeota archaeon]|tara:strand:+ start:1803 stop:2126 length:324 start_codon:yes stop_codon:yes gene_type:complete
MFSLVRLISKVLLRSDMNNQADIDKWWKDSMVLLSISLPSLIWLMMYLLLSLKIAWISFPCGILVGFFLWLIALGYENPRMAKATLIGVTANLVLALISAYYAFFNY